MFHRSPRSENRGGSDKRSAFDPFNTNPKGLELEYETENIKKPSITVELNDDDRHDYNNALKIKHYLECELNMAGDLGLKELTMFIVDHIAF